MNDVRTRLWLPLGAVLMGILLPVSALALATPADPGICDFKINRLNGGASIRYADINRQGTKLNLELIRTYYSIMALNEKSGWGGIFGWGWSSPIETSLLITSEKKIYLRDSSTGNPLSFQPANGVYVSTEFGYQIIKYESGNWIRERDGLAQYFDSLGRLVREKTREGGGLHYEYYTGKNKFHIKSIVGDDQSFKLSFQWEGDHVVEIRDERNHRVSYQYDDKGNLTDVTNADGQQYFYSYQDKKYPHLMTSVSYPLSTFRRHLACEIRYEPRWGAVKSFQDKNGDVTQYVYGKSKTDPKNGLWAEVTMYHQGKRISRELDEFYLAMQKDHRFLRKVVVKKDHVPTTTILLTPCCGKPEQIRQGNETTYFSYTSDGHLKAKVGQQEKVWLTYHPKWRSLTRASVNGLITNYEYDALGHLKRAFDSKKRSLQVLKLDNRDRLAKVLDGTKETLSFSYDSLGRLASIRVGSHVLEFDYSRSVSPSSARWKTVAHSRRITSGNASEKHIPPSVIQSIQNFIDLLAPMSRDWDKLTSYSLAD